MICYVIHIVKCKFRDESKTFSDKYATPGKPRFVGAVQELSQDLSENYAVKSWEAFHFL